MAEQVTKLKVFVASPGDVQEERDRLRTVIDELNLSIAGDKGLVLELVRWETHAWPGMGEDAQDVINREIGPYDVFIGIMWKRFGTPTKRAESGTKEEFNRAYELWQRYKRPHIMFYFCQTPFMPSSSQEVEQMGKVLAFKEELARKGGLYWEYEGAGRFEQDVRRHLSQVIRNWEEKADSPLAGLSGAAPTVHVEVKDVTDSTVVVAGGDIGGGIIARDIKADGSVVAGDVTGEFVGRDRIEFRPGAEPAPDELLTPAEELQYLKSLLGRKKRALYRLEKQKTIYAAGEEPLRLLNQIDEARREVRSLEEEIARVERKLAGQ